MGIVEDSAIQAWKPADDREPWEWAENYVKLDPTSPYQGYWKSDISPWVKQLMNCFTDNEITDISVMCSAQSAKTQTMICLLMWALSEEPAPTMWVTSTAEEASFFMKTRIIPTIKTCDPVKDTLINDRNAINKMEIAFNGASLICVGSSSPSRLQSKPVRWLFLDEVRNYPDGALEMVLKRTRAYWNARRCIVSTPDMYNDATHRAYIQGDQQVWHHRCRGCNSLFPMNWQYIKWDENEKTKNETGWNFDNLAPTIRFECDCGETYKDEPSDRRHFINNGCYVSLNPNAPKNRKSFHWNALLPPWVKWRDLVEEFLIAKQSTLNGDVSPLKDFINESLGEPWEDRLGDFEDYSFLKQQVREYELDGEWEKEYTRFLSADKQAKGGIHFWYVVRAFSENGAESRLIGYGKADSEEELLAIAEDYKVPSENCLMDSGYDTQSVYRFCQMHNWKPMKGTSVATYRHRNQKTGKVASQLWTWTKAEVGIGTKEQGYHKQIRLFLWSNDGTKDALAELMQGLVGNWTLPKDICTNYYQQVTAEKRMTITDVKGRTKYEWVPVRKDNHLFDCELMILVASLASKLTHTIISTSEDISATIE
jgi:phage terminase large subunit GpA-like protein